MSRHYQPCVVQCGDRVQEITDFRSMRCYVIVGLVVFLYRLNNTGTVRVTQEDVPGWARKGTREAFRFCRQRVSFSLDF